MWYLRIICVVLALAVAESILIEKYTKPCDASAGDFNDCAKSSFETLLKKSTNDNKELGLFSADPLNIPFIQIKKSDQLSMKFSKINIYGFSTSAVTSFDWDLKKSLMKFSLNVPYIELKGDYDINGKILLIKLEGQGPIFLNMSNLVMDTEIQFESKAEEKDGKHFLKIEKLSNILKPDLKTSYVLADNLFNDKTISDGINQAFNDDITTFLGEVLDPVNDAFPEILKNYFNIFFAKVPLEDLMLNPVIN